MKGYNLLLLSTKKLSEQEFGNIKKQMSGQMRNGLVLAMVSQSLMRDNNYVKIEVYNNSGAQICQKNNSTLYVYEFDSLVTNIRESQALKKMCRHRFITNPSSASSNRSVLD